MRLVTLLGCKRPTSQRRGPAASWCQLGKVPAHQYIVSTWLLSCARCSPRSFLQAAVAGSGRRVSPAALPTSHKHSCTKNNIHNMPRTAGRSTAEIKHCQLAGEAHRARASAGFSANCFLIQVATCTAGREENGTRTERRQQYPCTR